MYLEIAQIEIKPGQESEFEKAAAKAVSVFKNSRGCAGMELRRSVESPSKFLLFVHWETMEDHTGHFKNSPDGLQAWRKAVSHFYAGTPTLEHSQLSVAGFSKWRLGQGLSIPPAELEFIVRPGVNGMAVWRAGDPVVKESPSSGESNADKFC